MSTVPAQPRTTPRIGHIVLRRQHPGDFMALAEESEGQRGGGDLLRGSAFGAGSSREEEGVFTRALGPLASRQEVANSRV